MNIQAQAILIKSLNPPQLVVVGTVDTPHADDYVQLRLTQPPCFNPTILCLDLIVDETGGPMKMTPKPISYIDPAHTARTEKVQINLLGGGSVMVDVVTISR